MSCEGQELLTLRKHFSLPRSFLWVGVAPNSGQFLYPLPNMVYTLDAMESSVRTGAGNCPEFGVAHLFSFVCCVLLCLSSFCVLCT